MVLDITDAGAIASAVTQIHAAVGSSGLHAVVNVAGIGVPGPLEVLEPDQLRAELDVNVGGGAKIVSALRPLVAQRVLDVIGRRTAA